MDSLRRKPKQKKLPPLPHYPSDSTWVFSSSQKPNTSFSHSFTLSPYNPPKLPKRNPRKETQKPTLRKICIIIFILILLGSVFATALLIWRTYRLSQVTFIQRSESNIFSETTRYLFGKSKETRKPLRGEEDGRINILLLGKAGKNYPGQNLTDTIMVASINTKEKKTALLSLPRDFYARIPDTKTSAKLNSLYLLGQKEDDPFHIIRSAVEDVTGLPIHYSIVIDYDGFVSIVDALSGINVYVERDFYDPSYPGPNYSYETFEIKKGLHTLDGATALKYVRERHNDPQGDFGRSARQQQVLQAIKNKAFTVKTFLNFFTFYNLLDAIEENIRTDFSPEEVRSLLTLVQDIDTHNINTMVIDAWKKESLLRVSHIALENGQSMFVLIPRTGTYQEIQEAASTIFSQKEQQTREDKIREENARVLLINTTKNPEITQNIFDLLSDLGFQKIDVASPIDSHSLERTYVRRLSNNTYAFSLDEIIKKVPASFSGESLDVLIPKKIPENIDFTILIGNDIISNYLWEKGTMEEYLKENEK